eukprot:11153269-Alexandrium_andersonii.AAC.2
MQDEKSPLFAAGLVETLKECKKEKGDKEEGDDDDEEPRSLRNQQHSLPSSVTSSRASPVVGFSGLAGRRRA